MEKERSLQPLLLNMSKCALKEMVNSMYNMLSLSPSGTEQYMWHLRLLTAYSI